MSSTMPVSPAAGGGLRRVRLDISYDGSDLSGWAVQPGLRTVQGCLEDALAVLARTPVRLTVAGRTDAGVHATGQVAHADLAELPSLHSLNGLLAQDIRVRAVAWAPDGFDARFGALSRTYTYRVTDGVGDPLRRHDTVHVRRPLDEGLMGRAAQLLLGEQDFAAFCRHREGATTVRSLLRLDVGRVGEVVTFTVAADAFCRSMVRSLVGALLEVGSGHRPVDWPASLLARVARAGEVRVAQAHGLTLAHVAYPHEDLLAARAQLTRARRA